MFNVVKFVAVIKFSMCDKYVFIETVKSKGTLRTIKHVISKRKFEDEDVIVVRVLHADTQDQEDIVHLVVVDEHPDVQGKEGRPLNVFILGDFPQKDVPFHEEEVVALRGGCISENDKGTLELVFTSDKQNTILREDFGRYNKEDIFSKTAKFPTKGRRLPNESLKMIEKIKKWIGCGLVAAVSKELTLNEASLKSICRCNLVCKVLDVREIVPSLGIVSVADGSVCRCPFLTINNDKEVEFVSVDESDLSVDIIVTLKTEALKNLKKGSYVRLFGIQTKKFSLPLSEYKDCIILKIDGRIFSFESVVGSEKAKISSLLHKRNQHNNTADVSHNIADDSRSQLSVPSSSNESFTILTSGPQQNANSGGGKIDDDSQSILRLRAPPAKLRCSGTHSNIFGETQQSFHVKHKQHQVSGRKKIGTSREEQADVDSNDGDSGCENQRDNSTLDRAPPSKKHKPGHLSVGETYCDISPAVNQHADEGCAVLLRGHCARNCNITERTQCESSAITQSKEQVRPEINNGSTVQDLDTDEKGAGDEPLVEETQIGLRRLKYLPGIYHVNVWIKDVLPTLSGCPLDLITARCYICRKEQSYTRISKQQPHSEQQICLPCSSQGMPKFLELKFKFTLVLWDACEREISASVTGEEAEKFLKCSVYMYIRDEPIRQHVWNTLQKLKDRGCFRKYRQAQDLIEVDIGVTVERGFKKYMLLGGVLNNLEVTHKQ
ncbi:uncharacterized protein LOC126281745 isoform X1 [Schistocerca gregaria]|uniref:uncharacterized protein LOC126281745 isoform X1 n=1 Tax=Schistocerca gregaria TaxID=7010 RepID=UPI00211DD5B7|nr:uncharacterized protein LOC126281745 isoform X1 [Schistocerca gregaria]